MLLGMKSKRLSCVLLAGFFSYLTFLWLWYFARETFNINHKELGVKRPQFWFSHLQPLRDMFRNLTLDRKDKKHCMVASDEFSDLNEKGVKESVLLLIVVSTAPSRQDRREAIRQTWWTKCRGKVSVSLKISSIPCIHHQCRSHWLTETKEDFGRIDLEPLKMNEPKVLSLVFWFSEFWFQSPVQVYTSETPSF